MVGGEDAKTRNGGRGETLKLTPPNSAVITPPSRAYNFLPLDHDRINVLRRNFYTMAKSKSKRKQQGGQDGGSVAKKVKTSAIVTLSPDAGEPKTIQSVGLDEDDLNIAIDTLNMLVENPSVIKLKACKDLKTAVYDFRQACTTGFNATGLFISLLVVPS
jgi:hypothetical protein